MFDTKSGGYRHKNETAIKLRLNDKEPVDAFIFHVNGERLTDLLNDPRAFIPVRLANGDVMIVAKSQITSIIETTIGETENSETASAPKPSPVDPYRILRVAETASDEEIRAAFNTRIKAVHPDTIASLGLDDDLAAAASKSTQKIIYAYRKITRERKVSQEASKKQAAYEPA